MITSKEVPLWYTIHDQIQDRTIDLQTEFDGPSMTGLLLTPLYLFNRVT